MFETAIRSGAAVLDAAPPWGWLPEDEGRWAPPPDEIVVLEDLPMWDVSAGDRTGLPLTELRESRPAGYGTSDAGPGLESPGAAAPWASLEGIEGVPPDGMLALILEHVDVTAVDDDHLVEVVAAWQRLAGWVYLNGALAAAELSRRASMNPLWSAPAPANQNVAGDELAMRLGWSKPAANRLVRDGRALENELLLTADAVRDGRLDASKLRVVTDRLHGRPGQLAWAVQEQVLPGAQTRTPSQLERDIDRALLEVDPADAAFRLPAAVAKRHVCHPRALPDGMAGIWAVLPAADAAQVDATLDASARTARVLGDPRTLDQLRADTFVDLATGRALLAGGRRPAVGTAADDEPEGAAPADDERADVARDCDRSADGTLDEGTATAPTPTAARGPERVRLPQVRVNVTVALSTLLGLDERPAELAGFGPISAEQARALAAGGVWRRLVTDPLSGRVLDVGRSRYRPPRGLAEHVAARDGVCACPGCSTPADRCDIDHTEEFHASGQHPGTGTTSADNLGPLSRRCHRLKTDGGFTLRQVEPGVFEWRTPAGLTYRVVPGDHGRTERITAAVRPNPGYPDEPPF